MNRDTRDKTPAQIYALVFGVILLLIGILGFFADASFEAGSNISGGELLGFEVNGWHNLVHIASGLLGLAVWSDAAKARAYAIAFGSVYLVVTIWGFITGDNVLWLIPVNTADNFLHLVIAATGLLAGFASDPRTRSATAGNGRSTA
jgi:hypothetical protein